MGQEQKEKYIIVKPYKSLAASLLLTIFFGPFGLLYSSFVGAIVMLVLLFISMFLVPARYGAVLFFLFWFVASSWGVRAAEKYNKKIHSLYS